jgi:hypothetical protein
VWVKQVWRCPYALRPKRTWTETSEAIAPVASLTKAGPCGDFAAGLAKTLRR